MHVVMHGMELRADTLCTSLCNIQHADLLSISKSEQISVMGQKHILPTHIA